MIIDFYVSNVILILYTQLIILIALFAYNLKYIKKEFPNIKKYTLLILLAIMAFSIILQPTDMLADTKMKTLTTAKEFYTGDSQFFYPTNTEKIRFILPNTTYPWGSTYPFLLSVLFLIFGVNPILIVVLDKMMVGILIITVFFLLFLITKDEKNSILGTFFLSVILIFMNSFLGPQFTEMLFFFVSFSLLLMFLSYRMNKATMYALALISILFTMEIIFEAVTLLVTFLIGLFLYNIKNLRDRSFLKPFLMKIFIALLVLSLFSPLYFAKIASVKPYLYQTGITSYENPTKSLIDSSFGMFHIFFDNVYKELNQHFVNEFIWLWAHKILLFLTIFCLIGLLYGFKKYRTETILLGLFFIMHTFSYFIIGNGYQVNYALRSAIPLIVLSSFGIKALRDRLQKFDERATLIIFFAFFICLFIMYANDIPYYYNFTAYDFQCENSISELISKNTGTIVAASSIEYAIEFVTLRDAFTLQSLIPRKFPLKLTEEIKNRANTRLKYTMEFVFENQTLRNELFDIILEEGKDNYYIRYTGENCYSCMVEHEYIKEFFNTTLVFENECLEVYRIEKPLRSL